MRALRGSRRCGRRLSCHAPSARSWPHPHRDHRWRAVHGSGWRTRLKGYRRALKEAGLAYDTSLVVDGDWTVTAGYDSTRRAVGVIGTPNCDLLPERQDCVLDGYSTTTLSSIRVDLILAPLCHKAPPARHRERSFPGEEEHAKNRRLPVIQHRAANRRWVRGDAVAEEGFRRFGRLDSQRSERSAFRSLRTSKSYQTVKNRA